MNSTDIGYSIVRKDEVAEEAWVKGAKKVCICCGLPKIKDHKYNLCFECFEENPPEVTVSKDGRRYWLQSEYHPTIVSVVKCNGAKYDPATKQWYCGEKVLLRVVAALKKRDITVIMG